MEIITRSSVMFVEPFLLFLLCVIFMTIISTALRLFSARVPSTVHHSVLLSTVKYPSSYCFVPIKCFIYLLQRKQIVFLLNLCSPMEKQLQYVSVEILFMCSIIYRLLQGSLGVGPLLEELLHASSLVHFLSQYREPLHATRLQPQTDPLSACSSFYHLQVSAITVISSDNN